MRTHTPDEGFDFENSPAFGENGSGEDATRRFRKARPTAENENGSDPFEELCGPVFDCGVRALVAPDIGFIGGFFDDDGNRLDPERVSIPSLCTCCTRRDSADWEEETLCTLMRLDQRDSEEFCCDGYLPL